MTWDEMITNLRRAGLSGMNLPARGNSEGTIGLRTEGEKSVVSTTERGESNDIAEFATEEAAVDFIFDNMVFHFGLNGDTRMQRWNATRELSLRPCAENFGGRSK